VAGLPDCEEDEMSGHDATLLAYALRDTRRAFGYDYRVAEYADPALRWEEIAPWVRHSVVRFGHNLMEATVRELGPRMPVHDMPLREGRDDG
jgi:hypothetical protein